MRKLKFKLILISKQPLEYLTFMLKKCHSVVKRMPNFESENLVLHPYSLGSAILISHLTSVFLSINWE